MRFASVSRVVWNFTQSIHASEGILPKQAQDQPEIRTSVKMPVVLRDLSINTPELVREHT